ncbi:hypothetical protein, partial [Noviherbaspirillum sp. Root189]|uniref:hypothetical protein n=1 Tax=Noviherbaspirillum sp. Root189 TaxID=1736487 RepID=UPI001F481210
RLLPEGIGISIAVFLVAILRNTDGPENQGATSIATHDLAKEHDEIRDACLRVWERAAKDRAKAQQH